MHTVDLSVSGNSVCSFSMFLCFLIDVLIREFFISLSLGSGCPVEEWESTSLSPLRTVAVWSL